MLKPLSFLGLCLISILCSAWGVFLYMLSEWLMYQRSKLEFNIQLTISCILSLLCLAPQVLIFSHIPEQYPLLLYSFFISSLIISINTDLKYMLISRYVTLFIIPTAWLCSFTGLLPISGLSSVAGCLTAYMFLSLISYGYYLCTGTIGLGLGDTELLAFIGAWLGIQGWWFSLCCGSLVGSIIGLLLMTMWRMPLRTTKLPFGPFLAISGILYVYIQWLNIPFPF